MDFILLLMMIFMFSYLGFDGVVVWMARKCGEKKMKKVEFCAEPLFFWKYNGAHNI